MTFTQLSDYLAQLESTTSRLAITEILARLYKEVDAEEVACVSYLLQGRVAAVFAAVEFGIADKMMVRAIALATETSETEVWKLFKTEGDLGNVAETLKSEVTPAKPQKLSIGAVFAALSEVASSNGAGSQEKKLQLLSDLIAKIDPLSARYIVRIPLGKLRLGFSDMTVLDALSWMLAGDKSKRKDIERAFNVRPDLGFIAQTVKTHGVSGLRHTVPTVGTPILMARANRLTSAEDIVLKIGKCAVEFKYDGLRLQVHYQRGKGKGKRAKLLRMFSRNLEDVTPMFPDIAAAVEQQIDADEAIIEGEVVAYNPKTGAFVPFQETMQRKRKYNIAAKALEIPVKLYAFELLLLNGHSFIEEAYQERKKQLKQIISKGNTIHYAQETVVSRVSEIESLFAQSIQLHFEGIIAKKLNGRYEAGVRGWNWIKFKKAMDTKLADTIDCVVMGYTLGEGKRTSFGVGQFLAGVYDPKTEKYYTVTKVGTGLTDEQFREFITRAKPLVSKKQPPEYVFDTLLEPDVWLKPGLVVELGSDEITRSPVHTAGRIMGPSKSGTAQEVKTPGFALRFPRLAKFRDDKAATDATTVSEMTTLFKSQKK